MISKLRKQSPIEWRRKSTSAQVARIVIVITRATKISNGNVSSAATLLWLSVLSKTRHFVTNVTIGGTWWALRYRRRRLTSAMAPEYASLMENIQ